MSNDQVIRSTKPHEVTIPEGSNNARSIRNKVGQRDVEQDRQEKVTVDKHYTDRIVHGASGAVTDEHVEVEQASDDGVSRVAMGQEEQRDSERIKISNTDGTADHRVQIESSQGSDHRVAVESQSPASSGPVALPSSNTQDSYATLPPSDGATENRVAIPTHTQDDNHALLPDDAQSAHQVALPMGDSGDHRAPMDTDASSINRVPVDTQGLTPHRVSLEEDSGNSHSPAIEGATSSQRVSIPTDSLHDSFATTPDMTNTESSPVKVDGHGITDPDRVIVDGSPEVLNTVPVPRAEPQVPDTPPAPQEPHLAAAAVGLSPAVSAPKPTSPAQVTATLADKKAEEFRGRVVKLRDEVDQLNHRLDEFKK